MKHRESSWTSLKVMDRAGSKALTLDVDNDVDENYHCAGNFKSDEGEDNDAEINGALMVMLSMMFIMVYDTFVLVEMEKIILEMIYLDE